MDGHRDPHTPPWQWDELRHAGVDYADPEQVRAYDERTARYRDVRAGNQAVIDALALSSDDVLLEFGCGTGALGIQAAPLCREVIACDVSEAMLAYAGERARAQGVDNIRFHHGGFLTYRHEGPPVDAVASQVALHHLPDYWKAAALERVADALRPGGRFCLVDVVFSFPPTERDVFFENLTQRAYPEMRAEWETHLSREFSTLDWIMEGLLQRAGFTIERADYRDGMLAFYVCRKPA